MTGASSLSDITTKDFLMEKLIALYESWHGSKPSRTETIAAGGSNRQYYRIVDGQGKSVIGVIGTSRDENHAFIYLARHFTRRQLPVPQILAASDDELRYLQTDLGHEMMISWHEMTILASTCNRPLQVRASEIGFI